LQEMLLLYQMDLSRAVAKRQENAVHNYPMSGKRQWQVCMLSWQ